MISPVSIRSDILIKFMLMNDLPSLCLKHPITYSL